MKRLALSFTVIVCCSLLYAQQSIPQVKNIRTSMDHRNLVVRYNITGCTANELHHVDLAIVDNRGHVIRPDSILGDFGPGITCGSEKKITWEIYKEYDVVHGHFNSLVVLDKGAHPKHMRGPEYALLSLLVPGLGDYFVADPANLRIKPYMKTVTTLGILGLSWLALEKREEVPPLMAPPGWYLSADAPPGEELKYFEEEWMQKPGYTDYFLFDYDAEIIFGIGMITWVADVIWVLRKGVVNQRVMKSIRGDLSLTPVALGQGAKLTYRLTF